MPFLPYYPTDFAAIFWAASPDVFGAGRLSENWSATGKAGTLDEAGVLSNRKGHEIET